LFTFLFLAAAKPAANREPYIDRAAPVVALFDGIDRGLLEVRVAPKFGFEPDLFLTNSHNRPLTVAFPKAAALVHEPTLLASGGGENGSGFGGGGQGMGGAFVPHRSATGRFHVSSDGGNLPAGSKVCTIRPGEAMQLTIAAVCLEQGKPDPRPGMHYRLERLETVTSNRVLISLLENNDARTTGRMPLQAAAWHLADSLSWQQLRSLMVHHAGDGSRPLFTRRHLAAGKKLAALARNEANPPGAIPESPSRDQETPLRLAQTSD
jgi:hypothetical protein